MAITQAIANAFKKQLLEGDQNFASSGGDKACIQKSIGKIQTYVCCNICTR